MIIDGVIGIDPVESVQAFWDPRLVLPPSDAICLDADDVDGE